ncbi:ABC transporter ATP-binding protein [Pinibacter aurantiacus]|uniref:ABC transporter ATP-binding protein n=1 Tax=Pinibacter aurantiacus TaxID=2851599 RepID=A0A9E2SF32_9BACT|nr:ABC transporter ATP-binding protein [Pinibacter aurantiacus]MBV4360669.1 ABC transporter ATP-binding protein [Pinibacter aurantiacus]
MNLLQIKNLHVEFTNNDATTKALHGISFEVNNGEIVAVVGESGSGKSVTAMSILQLLPSPPAKYTSGEILFSDDAETTINLLNLPEKELRSIRGNKISMIFQEPMTSLNPVFSCGQQVAEAIQLHDKVSKKEALQRTVELFKQVQLPDPDKIINRYPFQLSGGQKQRVMIAMAMSCNPSLLIADEPTTALDVTVQKRILQLIKELQQQNNMGVIFITHDLGVVAEIADKVVVMYKGNIVEQGPTKTVLQSPKHPYTQALLQCRPALHPKGERLPVISDFLEPKQHTKPLAKTVPEQKKNSAETLLEVRDLTVKFPSVKNFFGRTLEYNTAVNNVSFDIYKGETLGLVGESGCGKTTLGRTLLRLQDAQEGKIIFEGKDLLAIDKNELRTRRKDFQIVFQDPYSSLNPRKTAGRAIVEPLQVHEVLTSTNKRKELAMELLGKVNLQPEHFYRYPHEFSGGQRQRIGIARALALNPGFIVFDESVSALDVSVQAQVLNLLTDLKNEFNFTAIFISHDLSVVKYISDRIMVMRKGKIEEIGYAEAVYNNPQSAYTAQLLSAIPTV